MAKSSLSTRPAGRDSSSCRTTARPARAAGLLRVRSALPRRPRPAPRAVADSPGTTRSSFSAACRTSCLERRRRGSRRRLLSGGHQARAGGDHRQGRRTAPTARAAAAAEWLKIKTHNRQEAVIGGFTEPRGIAEGSRRAGAGRLRGGRPRLHRPHRRRLGRQGTRRPSRETRPADSEGMPLQDAARRSTRRSSGSSRDWSARCGSRNGRPMVACASRSCWACARTSRPGRSAARSRPWSSPTARHTSSARRRKTSAIDKAADGEEPTLTNLDKVYWPEDGYTKGDLIAYYRDIAPVILPYLRDRPLSLHRHPDGINGKSLLPEGREPKPASRSGSRPFRSTPNRPARPAATWSARTHATLLYLANLGCIEINPWNARVGSLDHPDYLVIDLDPEDRPVRAGDRGGAGRPEGARTGRGRVGLQDLGQARPARLSCRWGRA